MLYPHLNLCSGITVSLCLLSWSFTALVRAENPATDWKAPSVLPSDLNLSLFQGNTRADQPSVARQHRIRLFRIEPGFISDPIGLDQDDGTLPEQKAAESSTGPDWFQVAMGSDNPYFDFRQRGEPGGVGFFRLNTQVQLLDSRTTGFALGLQAVTPAGLEYAGIPDNQGATVVSPALSLFHTIDDNTALQGFVGKNVLLNPGGPNQVHKNLKYGMAVQRPVVPDGPDTLKNLFLSVGALGLYRLDRESLRSPVAWEVMPGFHWKMADNWWVSGGVAVPVSAARTEPVGRWQVTFRLQF
jgi:hypothetical protein